MKYLIRQGDWSIYMDVSAMIRAEMETPSRYNGVRIFNAARMYTLIRCPVVQLVYDYQLRVLLLRQAENS